MRLQAKLRGEGGEHDSEWSKSEIDRERMRVIKGWWGGMEGTGKQLLYSIYQLFSLLVVGSSLCVLRCGSVVIFSAEL